MEINGQHLAAVSIHNSFICVILGIPYLFDFFAIRRFAFFFLFSFFDT